MVVQKEDVNEFPELAATLRSFFFPERMIIRKFPMVFVLSLLHRSLSAWLSFSCVPCDGQKPRRERKKWLVPRDWSLLVPLPDSPLPCSASLKRDHAQVWLHFCMHVLLQ